MSTDDRDIESSNPSKNFKVGEFDQRSGFFTPVWESKRRIRSEPPPPSSRSAADSAGSSPSKPGSLPPGSANVPPTRAAAGAASPESSSANADATGAQLQRRSGAGVPRPRAASERPRAPSERPRSASGRPASTKPGAGAAKAAESAATASQHDTAAAVVLPPAVAAVFNAAPEPAAAAPDADTAAQRSLDRSLDTGQRGSAGKTPSAAARALQSAGPDLPPAAFLDEEPDFRPPLVPSVPRPARAERPAQQQRALRASAAATRVHEQLKAKLQAEAAEIAESRYELEPETNRTPLQDLELQGEPEPFPLSSLRHLRRTLRLSTPVPESIRSSFSKYDRG